jgi:hypothetical protein
MDVVDFIYFQENLASFGENLTCLQEIQMDYSHGTRPVIYLI